ncbi:MAG: ELWxxDGT repeat protein [Planctomycetota bacterium]|jgi:ELWxxDGT repeat protein
MGNKQTKLNMTGVLVLILALVSSTAAQNTPPVADAGEDQNICVNEATGLEGSATDPDNDPIVAWVWTVESAPEGSTTYLPRPDLPDYDFGADTAGDYVLSLIASDGIHWSEPDTVTIHVGMGAECLFVDPGYQGYYLYGYQPVGSENPQIFTITNMCDGNGIEISDISLTPDSSTDFAITGAPALPLTLDPGQSAEVEVTFAPSTPYYREATLVINSDDAIMPEISIHLATSMNRPPVADAGSDQSIFIGESTMLQGSATDPTNDPIVAWLWSVESSPEGSSPYISRTDLPNPTFDADMPGDYVLSLKAADALHWSEPDYVTIHVFEWLPPVAVATADVISGPAPLTVQFDGSQSIDPQGCTLAYDWDFGDGSRGSREISPTHVYQAPGTYTATLLVTDTWRRSDYAMIEITVTSSPPKKLWSSDGTQEGTVPIETIDFGDYGSSYAASFNGYLFFVGRDAEHGYELWKTDGTPESAAIVKDLWPGPDSSRPWSFTCVNETLFFVAQDPNGTELWKTDGTEAGTVMVKDISPGAGSSFPSQFMNVNDILFFAASDGVHNKELWKTDGTKAGTVLVKDIYPGAGNPYLGHLVDLEGTLFFRAYDGAEYGLWKSDGTEAGTVKVKGMKVYHMASINGALFISSDDGAGGSALWKSDGTEAGTVMVRQMNPIGGGMGKFVDLNGTVLFSARDGFNGPELWKTDGTEAGTVMVKDINPGAGGSSPSQFVVINDILFFVADDGIHGGELWKTDGTEAGTVMIQDIQPEGLLIVYPNYFPFWGMTDVNDLLFFAVADGIHGIELWRSDGTAEGTFLTRDIRSGRSSSIPMTSLSFFTEHDNKLFFTAYAAPPTADAGVDQVRYPGEVVTLDGSGSFDVDGDYPLSYAWALTEDPNDSTAVLTDPNTVSPSFTPDLVGTYVIKLIMTDSLGQSDVDTVEITVTPGGNIEVSPEVYDFGDVELGSSSSAIITITNPAGGTYEDPLTLLDISLAEGGSGSFAVTANPAGSVVQPGESVDVGIVFTPSAEGYVSTTVQIASDDPVYPLIEVPLGGVGVFEELPPEGDGPGGSAENRLSALQNMIEACGDLIEDGLHEDACDQLAAALKKCDGQPKPPDFVAGDAAPVVESMIEVLRATLGCE